MPYLTRLLKNSFIAAWLITCVCACHSSVEQDLVRINETLSQTNQPKQKLSLRLLRELGQVVEKEGNSDLGREAYRRATLIIDSSKSIITQIEKFKNHPQVQSQLAPSKELFEQHIQWLNKTYEDLVLSFPLKITASQKDTTALKLKASNSAEAVMLLNIMQVYVSNYELEVLIKLGAGWVCCVSESEDWVKLYTPHRIIKEGDAFEAEVYLGQIFREEQYNNEIFVNYVKFNQEPSMSANSGGIYTLPASNQLGIQIWKAEVGLSLHGKDSVFHFSGSYVVHPNF